MAEFFSGNLFDEEEQNALNFAGEIGMEGDFQIIEGEVAHTLQEICSSLIKRWNERQTETSLQLSTISIFACPQDLTELQPTEKIRLMQGKLQDLIFCLPQHQGDKFDSLTATPGYISWNDFFTQKKKMPINIVWEQWIAHLNPDDLLNFEMFIDLFENVQI